MKNIEIVNNPSTLHGLRVVQNIEDVIKALKDGETIARYEFGSSMRPILVSGQYARLEPLKEEPQIGDAVFCCVHGHWMTHMIWMKNRHSGSYLIGSTSGQMYGWTNKVLAIAKPMPFKEVDNNED